MQTIPSHSFGWSRKPSNPLHGCYFLQVGLSVVFKRKSDCPGRCFNPYTLYTRKLLFIFCEFMNASDLSILRSTCSIRHILPLTLLPLLLVYGLPPWLPEPSADPRISRNLIWPISGGSRFRENAEAYFRTIQRLVCQSLSGTRMGKTLRSVINLYHGPRWHKCRQVSLGLGGTIEYFSPEVSVSFPHHINSQFVHRPRKDRTLPVGAR